MTLSRPEAKLPAYDCQRCQGVWKTASGDRCGAQAETLRQSFMYGTPVVAGNDLLVISRTSINGRDQHDADHATFHRVRDFRSLALNLFPER